MCFWLGSHAKSNGNPRYTVESHGKPWDSVPQDPTFLHSIPRDTLGGHDHSRRRPAGLHGMLWHVVRFQGNYRANDPGRPRDFPWGVSWDPVGSHDTFHDMPIPVTGGRCTVEKKSPVSSGVFYESELTYRLARSV